eukprot:CAMPEP_0170194776 /NCGR_PEP_ID=MMETSP0040_2-20121228/60001_1 /TAXON_ID=641309 /ORGANISM="Lotharella oceanica, Strain CCMP622" /LENGTH=324 /DNA_ID=CAMNT_0010443761 /DNA_START=33 /DNA_END=1007 /DNA_ORIENTATION=-
MVMRFRSLSSKLDPPVRSMIGLQLPESSSSESESSDDTVDNSYNPLTNISDATVKMLSSQSGSLCGIHSSDQCLVRCVQCLESFCSGLVLYDIHREVDQAWSCRSCLLQPASALRKPDVFHSAALATSVDTSSDSILLRSLMEPVCGALRSIPEIPSNEPPAKPAPEVCRPAAPLAAAPAAAAPAPAPVVEPIQPNPIVDIKELESSETMSLKRLPRVRPRSRRVVNPSVSLQQADMKNEAKPVSAPSVAGSKRSRVDDYVSSKGGKRLKRFRCSYCPKRFDQRSNLIAHIRSHTGEKPFTCKVCKRPFSQKSNMTRHMKVHRR